jgi:hypothetical protein
MNANQAPAIPGEHTTAASPFGLEAVFKDS